MEPGYPHFLPSQDLGKLCLKDLKSTPSDLAEAYFPAENEKKRSPLGRFNLLKKKALFRQQAQGFAAECGLESRLGLLCGAPLQNHTGQTFTLKA